MKLCLLVLCLSAVFAEDQWKEVKIKQGLVRGRKHPSGNTYAFYNIPYATAPVGENKFKAPLPPPKWSKPIDAVGKNIVCPQIRYMVDLIPGDDAIQEDCLVAHVYVPDTEEKNLSVLVYVHGGGFILGFGSMMSAQKLLEKKDFIMVTFNYRLGIHGFVCLGTEDIPGNAGMKDQVAALRWVQENIASFGGNPSDVTLAGGSAGSAAVDLLILSKSAEGLFHRVIAESGGSLASFTIQRDPLEIAKIYARSQNSTNADDIYALEQFYKTAPVELQPEAYMERTDSTFLFSPCVERDTGDGAFLTESPLSILKKGNYYKVPMLYGFANMEGLMRIEHFENWKPKMNENFSDFFPANLWFESDEDREKIAKKVKTFYFGDKPVGNDNILGYVNYFSDIIFTHPMLWATKLQVEAGNNQIYLYDYAFVDEDTPVVPHTNIRGANHGAQSLAVFDGNLLDTLNENNMSREYITMKKTIRELWHNFIKTGKPVPEGSSLPTWPPAGADRSPHMVLKEKLELRVVLLEERTRFWDDIYQRYHRDAVPPPKPPPKSRVEL